ncbi:hypothetical protein F5B22DRAFT_399370 [Xylaria bambusicola]|uniref:uncharacterized protein n=1 Tax=Xylaria bambusicola TaxID=326684 RepID=UPI002008AE9F|nr:uncharacterized protein F5B22DRAFT_399370 [Xylaria bambusicola]KAI0508500.1 hypothetical protein F5B22DRAFT_399370 [Xylaria bambusicola]
MSIGCAAARPNGNSAYDLVLVVFVLLLPIPYLLPIGIMSLLSHPAAMSKWQGELDLSVEMLQSRGMVPRLASVVAQQQANMAGGEGALAWESCNLPWRVVRGFRFWPFCIPISSSSSIFSPSFSSSDPRLDCPQRCPSPISFLRHGSVVPLARLSETRYRTLLYDYEPLASNIHERGCRETIGSHAQVSRKETGLGLPRHGI